MVYNINHKKHDLLFFLSAFNIVKEIKRKKGHEMPENQENPKDDMQEKSEKLGADKGASVKTASKKSAKSVKTASGKFVCKFTVKEDGATYRVGEYYKGENSAYLLKKGAIVKA